MIAIATVHIITYKIRLDTYDTYCLVVKSCVWQK